MLCSTTRSGGASAHETLSAASHCRQLLLLAAAAVLVFGGATATQAGVVTGYAGASGPGLGVVTFGSISTPSPSNDDVAGASPNTIVLTEKRFDTFDGIWTIWSVADDGISTTEYQFTETVTNNTGDNAIGYQVMLGMGTDATWEHQDLDTGLDFDHDDDNSPRDFAVLGFLFYDQVTIDAGGAVILPGESHTFTYAIDVPSGITQFTMRTSLRAEPVSVESATFAGVKALFR